MTNFGRTFTVDNKRYIVIEEVYTVGISTGMYNELFVDHIVEDIKKANIIDGSTATFSAVNGYHSLSIRVQRIV